MKIRMEEPEDFAGIRAVNLAAFGRESEANLVDQLRLATSTISLVAVEGDRVVGHIFFSPVLLEGTCFHDLKLLGLAPMAVLPDYQRQGIGSLLIQHSLEEHLQSKFSAVVVLGHTEYYPRFGFVPAREKGLGCDYFVPDEAFMVLELKSGALEGCSGIIKYHSAFEGV
jgi:putative acetyltransferase